MIGEQIPAGVQIAQALFDACCPRGRLVNHSETQWASATFSGARHNFTIRFDGPGSHTYADSLVERITADDVQIAGHLVADLTVTAERFAHKPQCFAEVDISALTVVQPWEHPK